MLLPWLPPARACRAAFYPSELSSLKQLVRELSPAQLVSLDPQGNTPLHVAVLQHNMEAIQVLLDAGVSPEVGTRGWGVRRRTWRK